MFQLLNPTTNDRIVTLRDGRVSGFGQPEPQFLQRKYEQAEALREIQRETRIRRALEEESQGFVERLRTALGLAQ